MELHQIVSEAMLVRKPGKIVAALILLQAIPCLKLLGPAILAIGEKRVVRGNELK